MVVDRLLVELGLDADDFIAGIDSSGEAIGDFAKALEGLSDEQRQATKDMARLLKDFDALQNTGRLGEKEMAEFTEVFKNLVLDGAAVPKHLEETAAAIRATGAASNDAADSVRRLDDEMKRGSVSTGAAVEGWRQISEWGKNASAAAMQMVSSVLDSADALDNLSNRTGISVEALQKFEYAGSTVGVGMREIAIAMQRFQRGLEGESKATESALRGIGLSFAELKAMSPEDQLAAVLDGISKLGSASERSATATALLGRSGSQLVALGPAYRELSGEAERYGVVTKKEAISATDALGDAIGKLDKVLGGLKGNLVGAFLTSPPVKRVVDETTAAAGRFSKWLSDDAPSSVRVAAGAMTAFGVSVTAVGGKLLETTAAFATITSGFRDMRAMISAGELFAGFLSSVRGLRAIFAAEGFISGTAFSARFVAGLAGIALQTSVFASIGMAIGSAIIAGVVGYIAYKGAGLINNALENAIGKKLTGLKDKVIQTMADIYTFGAFSKLNEQAAQEAGASARNTTELLRNLKVFYREGTGPGSKKTVEPSDQVLNAQKQLNALLIEEAQLRAQKSGFAGDQVRVIDMQTAARVKELEQAKKVKDVEKETIALINQQIAAVQRLGAARKTAAWEEADKAWFAARDAVKKMSDSASNRANSYATASGLWGNAGANSRFGPGWDLDPYHLMQGKAMGQATEIQLRDSSKLATSIDFDKMPKGIAAIVHETKNWGSELSSILQSGASLAQLFGKGGKIIGGIAGLAGGLGSITDLFGPKTFKAFNDLGEEIKGGVTKRGFAAFKESFKGGIGNTLGALASTFSAVGAVAGPVIGAIKGWFEARKLKKIGADAGKVLGTSVSQETAKAIRDTMKSEKVSLEVASLLNLDRAMGDSGKDARTFATQVQKLMKGIQDGSIPAAKGLEQVSNAFSSMVAAAKDAGSVGDRAVTGILKMAREMGGNAYTEEMKAYTEEKLNQAAEGLKKYVDGISKLDGEFGRMATNSATMFMATFNAIMSEQGWKQAVDQLMPAFEVLQKKLTEIGSESALALLGPFSRFAEYLENEVLAGALDAVSGLQQMMVGLADAGYLDLETFTAMQETAADLFNHMLEGGMEARDALLAMAPAIQAAISAAEQFGVPLSADMQTLKDMAEQNGITFSTDPMLRVVEVLEAIAKALGADLPAAADKASAAFGSHADTADVTFGRVKTEIEDTALALDEQMTTAIQRQTGVLTAESAAWAEKITEFSDTQLMGMVSGFESAVGRVREISSSLDELNGKEVETTIYVNEKKGSKGGDGGGSGDDPISAASGFYSPSMPYGPLAQGGTPMVVHPDEEVYVGPANGGGLRNQSSAQAQPIIVQIGNEVIKRIIEKGTKDGTLRVHVNSVRDF